VTDENKNKNAAGTFAFNAANPRAMNSTAKVEFKKS